MGRGQESGPPRPSVAISLRRHDPIVRWGLRPPEGVGASRGHGDFRGRLNRSGFASRGDRAAGTGGRVGVGVLGSLGYDLQCAVGQAATAAC